MIDSRVRGAIVTGALAIVLMTPAYDGDGRAVSEPWYRNTFVKLRAEGTPPVELPIPVSLKRPAVQAQPVPPPEVQLPGVVQNLRRAEGR